MAWTEKDLQRLKDKGLIVVDNHIKNTFPKLAKKPKKISSEKNTIEYFLKDFVSKGFFESYVLEHRFDAKRRFRFDWAIPSLMIGIEYEGIFSKKSRHTTLEGYSTDTEKYNLAASQGWTVLRYTASNYQNIEQDLLKIFEKNK